jgi:4-amino-4-deoxy-L-arabinose transferase-like glycosyltransferase
MTHAQVRHRQFTVLLAASLLLALMFGLAVGSMLRKSPTIDEGLYIVRGLVFWKTGRLMSVGHPPLTSLLGGLGGLLEPNLPHVQQLPGWKNQDIVVLSRDLLWREGVDASRVVFLSRLPIVFLGLLFGAVVWRWARDLYGPWAASLALALFALSPNVLAHTGLATTDLGVAAFYVATLYAWSRYLHKQSVRWLVVSGVLFGLAQSAKFSALLLIPTMGLMTLWFGWRAGAFKLKHAGGLSRAFERIGGWPLGWLWTALLALLLMGLLGAATLWATYLFAVGQMAPGYYSYELRSFLSLTQAGHRAYLLGRFSQTGWWYYYLIVLGVKVPVPTLLLLVAAVAVASARGAKPREWEALFPALLFLGVTFVSPISAGARYLLPVLPLLFVFAGRLLPGETQVGCVRLAAVGVMLIGLLVRNVMIFPDYLSFFNLIAGGADNGAKVLVDSNLDWGQDLPALADYLHRRGAGRIYLSYFGQADPAYYGIDYLALPSFPPPIDGTPTAEFYPLNPAPGLYAISATNVVGESPEVKDTYSYFRDRVPMARVGHSIYIYDVLPASLPSSGRDTAWLAQCAAPAPLEREGTFQALTGLPDLRVFNFDCTSSLPFQDGPGWVALPAGIAPIIDLGAPDYTARNDDGSPRYRMWFSSKAPEAPASTVEFPAVALPLPIAGNVELLGYTVSSGSVPQGDVLTLTEWWRVREPPPPPVSFFAHLLRSDGSLALAGDALGVIAENWRPGMVIVQRHTFPITDDIAPGEYSLAVGLYDLNTGQRYAVSRSGDRVVDRIVLRNVLVTEPARR